MYLLFVAFLLKALSRAVAGGRFAVAAAAASVATELGAVAAAIDAVALARVTCAPQSVLRVREFIYVYVSMHIYKITSL